ncbi:alpha/beta-Hydrolases superfamily protein [Euphorbia peplus]|nr:alpha/beta-Hydrolases superfamily protein [Euphorbia peplus]
MNTATLHLKPPPTNLLPTRNPLQICQFRLFKRRRIKRSSIRSQQQLDPFQNFLSKLPSSNYLDFIAPVLGIASGFTLYLSQFRSSNSVSDIGEWILFSGPSAFNRFVFLRCPSIEIERNERLVEEDRHFGRMMIQVRESGLEDTLVYQRVCVNTEDGGVISLDWPDSLDLKEEYGLDSTMLIVPGTPEGSGADNVREFVCEALKCGFFPVVMNPRGCAGSPLTTARLFTAADSDDVCTAVQFINKTRPWASLMGIGWEYGANMLTKYLAEVGERTPLIAAACINNPFDLEEATRCSPYCTILDQKLTGGLIDILRSNKELFQGRTKGFNVERALTAKSVRDFENALSMVSYGFNQIEDFYLKSSTRHVVRNVKIPLLFIQSDDATVPLFSTPRNLIAENPFTSLLLCSCAPSSIIASERAIVSWCQNLTIEWLSAVELGLLKGRHPLLKDIDVNFNLSKDLTLVEGRTAGNRIKDDKFFDLTLADDSNYAVDPPDEVIGFSNIAVQSRSGQDSQAVKVAEGLQKPENGSFQQSSSVGTKQEVAAPAEEEVAAPADSESGEVLQTAEFVMNMLDSSMPGILGEEKKKKVLLAVGQGETLMKALQDAVPEEVSGNLTSAVSGIMNAQNTSLKLTGLLGFSKLPDMESKVISQNEETSSELPNTEGTPNDPHTSDEMKKVDDSAHGSHDSEPGSGQELEPSSESLDKSTDLGDSQTVSSQQGDIIGSDTMDINDETPPIEIKMEDSNPKDLNSSTDESITASGDVVEEAPPLAESSTDSQPVEKEGNDNQNTDKQTLQLPDQNKPTPSDSDPATFDVVQAMDAFTGMDDSTQVAVNSVFGVIEDMITQFEEENGHKNETKVQNDIEDDKIDRDSYEEPAATKVPNETSLEESLVDEDEGNDANPQNSMGTGSTKKELADSSILHDNKVNDDPQRSAPSNYEYDEGTKKHSATGHTNETDYTDKLVNGIPSYITANSYRDYLQNEYFRRYLLSKKPNRTPLDLDTTTALLFDYYPEDGQWKLLEQPGIDGDSIHETEAHYGGERDGHIHSPENMNDTESYIEPSYVVLDTAKQQESFGEYGTAENLHENVEIGNDRLEVMEFVKNIILDSLTVEIARKLSADDMKEIKPSLANDIEQVANAVSLAIGLDKSALCILVKEFCTDNIPEKVGTLQGDSIVRIISSAVLRTTHLRRVLPVGVVIGSSLAALRKYFDVGTRHDNVLTLNKESEIYMEEDLDKSRVEEGDHMLAARTAQTTSLESTRRREVEEDERKRKTTDGVMAGAVTAALGASALLMQQQNSYQGEETVEGSSKTKEKLNSENAVQKDDETEKNMVASLAEKAMSVASPVVPTTEDGEVDQERIVAMLAGWGQKGGMLRLVGKVALLWGGIRGAVSLTDKLISFLHMAERPLYQRIIGFFVMVLVLWSPFVVPFLPALVQSWTTNRPSQLANLVIIAGLYIAVTILVMIWGKRIRGYKDPLEEYGLDLLKLTKIRNLFVSLIGGVVLVFSIQSVNVVLGCASFSWTSNIPNLKAFGQVITLAIQGIITATGVVLVEELLFRAWLPEEISADLGYHQGIIISGLTYSLLQRSPQAVPGLWLLSLALSGSRQRNQGSLSVPIGLRAGIMASSFILQKGGFLAYEHNNYPLWVTGTHPFEPFSGIVGIAFALLLAIILYPRQPLQKMKLDRTVRE